MSAARLQQLGALNDALVQIEAALRDVAVLRQSLEQSDDERAVYHAFGGVFFLLTPQAKTALVELKRQEYAHLEAEQEKTQQQLLALLVPTP